MRMKLFPWRRDCDHRMGSFCRTYNRQRDAYVHALQNEIQALVTEVADLNEGIAWHKRAGAQLASRLATAQQTVRDLEFSIRLLGFELNEAYEWDRRIKVACFESPTTSPAEWRRSNPEECRRD